MFQTLPNFWGVVWYNLSTDPLSDMWFEKFLPVCGSFLDFLNKVLHRVEVLNFINNFIIFIFNRKFLIF